MMTTGQKQAWDEFEALLDEVKDEPIPYFPEAHPGIEDTPAARHWAAEMDRYYDGPRFREDDSFYTFDFRLKVAALKFQIRSSAHTGCPAPGHLDPSSPNTKVITTALCGWCGEEVQVRERGCDPGDLPQEQGEGVEEGDPL